MISNLVSKFHVLCLVSWNHFTLRRRLEISPRLIRELSQIDIGMTPRNDASMRAKLASPPLRAGFMSSREPVQQEPWSW